MMSQPLNHREGQANGLRKTAKNRPSLSAGFTLPELLVAVGLTGIVAVGLYALSVTSAQALAQQQRISEIQLRLRGALETLRSDIQRAGYMSTPGSAVDPRVCPKPTTTFQAVFLQRANPNPTFNQTDNTLINPVILRLVGNYVSTDEYRVMGVNGNTVFLQHKTVAFNRVTDEADMERIFRNRWVRIQGNDGVMQYGFVQAITYAPSSGTALPSLELTTPPTVINGGTTGCGIAGLGVGATVAPVSIVEYRIEAPTSNVFNEPASYFTGRTDLVREEITPTNNGVTAVTGTRRSVAEYAVDFDVSAVVDNGTGTETQLNRLAFGQASNFTLLSQTGAGGAAPHRVRALQVRLSVRDRYQDPDFAWVARSSGDPLQRFRIFPNTPGAARVRSATTEIALPNLAMRNLR